MEPRGFILFGVNGFDGQFSTIVEILKDKQE